MRVPTPLKALLLLAALALVAIAMLAQGDGAPPPPVDDANVNDAISQGSDASIAEASATTGERLEVDADVEPPAPEGSGRMAVDADDDEPPPTEGPLVRVERRDAAGKPQPAADVEVAWVLLEEGNRRASELPAAQQRPRESEMPQQFGQKARTGSDGTLRLPPLLGDTCVAASATLLFAYQRVERRHKEVRLLLEPDETLTLLVIDGQDRRQKQVPRALSWTAENEPPNAFWRGLSDARGEAIVRHFQLVRPGGKNAERFVASIAAPLQEPSAVEFAARPAPADPVRLQLTATRSLAVAILHSRGAPLLAPLGLTLIAERKLDPKWAAMLPRGFDRLRADKRLGREPALFAHVGVGMTVRAYVRLPSEERPRDLGPIPIPSDDSGPLTVQLRLPDDVRVIALRATAADGSPLGNADLPWQLRLPRSPGQSGNLQTLADGSGDFLVPSEGDPNAPLSADPMTLVLRETIDPTTVLGATVPLSVLVRGERRDLGTVAMKPEPLLARGRVVDDRGEPRINTRVHVELALQTDDGERWNPAPHLQKQTAEDGTFAFFAPAPTQQFRLVAASAGDHFTGLTGPLSPGAVVLLVQPRAGILQGRVIPPRDTPENSITLALVREDPTSQERRPTRPNSTPIRRRNGYFWLGNLQPGLYTATVAMRGLPSPLATFASVRIDPGTNEDGRLSPLDLSSSLHRYRLRAVSPNGQPLTALDGPILWQHQPAGAEGPNFAAFRWQQGKADFFLPVAFADFVLVGQGFASTSVALAAGERDVLLQPITPYPIELPGVRSLAGPVRSIRVSAVFTGETGLPQGIGGQDQQKGEGFSFPRWQLGKSGGGWLDRADRTDLVVSRSGPHELTLRLYEGEARDGRQMAIPLGTHELLVDGSALRPLVLPVDFAQLQQALQSLAPRPDQGPRITPQPGRDPNRRRG